MMQGINTIRLQCLGSADEATLRKARAVLLDTVACALFGQRHGEVRRLADTYDELDPGNARLPGLPSALTVSGAAIVWGAATCWDEWCGGNARARGRPGLHAVTGIVPLLSARPTVTLSEVLRALLVGYEVGARLAERVELRSGWHVDGTWGTVSAAAASAQLLNASDDEFTNAVNIAACQMSMSVYRPIETGDTVRNLYAGLGSARGIQATQSALAGISAPADSLTEGLSLIGERADSGEPSADGFMINDEYAKEFGACRHVLYAIEAARELIASGYRVDGADAMSLRMHPEAVTNCANRFPTSTLQAQFSATYCAAYVLANGDFDSAAFGSGLTDPKVRALEERITFDVGEGRADGARYAELEVSRSGGRCINVSQIPGDASMPIEPEQIADKAVSMLADRFGKERVVQLSRSVLNAEGSTPIASILDVLTV